MKRIFLGIGIDEYTSAAINPLKWAKADVDRMEHLFRPAGFTIERIDPPDQRARTILDKIDSIMLSLKDGDLLVVYLAGHGFRYEGLKFPFFLCQDADMRTMLGQGRIGTNDFLRLTERPGLQRVFLWDLCRNNLTPGRTSAIEGFRGADGLRSFVAAARTTTTDTSLAFLASCSDGGQAQEHDSLQGGLFAVAFESVWLSRLKDGREVCLDGKFREDLASFMHDLARSKTLNHTQQPWYESSCHRDPLLVPGSSQQPEPEFRILIRRQKAPKGDWEEQVRRLEELLRGVEEQLAQSSVASPTPQADHFSRQTALRAERRELLANLNEARSELLHHKKRLFEADWELYQAECREDPNPAGVASLWTALCAKHGVSEVYPAPGLLEWREQRVLRTLVQKTVPWENSLGMRFVPAGSQGLLFSTWMTRVRDFRAFVNETGYDATQGGWSFDPEDKSTGKSQWKQRGHHWMSPGFEQGEDHPVVCVSYLDAKAFCLWLTERERKIGLPRANQEYRLPFDVEWSRAVGNSKYPWGDPWPPPPGAGNYCGEEFDDGWNKIKDYNDGWKRTSPVGAFTSNTFGLSDLGGNAWEYCEDFYKSDMNTAEAKAAWPALADDGGGNSYHVLRGGSWIVSGPVFLEAGCRGFESPTVRRDYSGFRVVLVLDSSPLAG